MENGETFWDYHGGVSLLEKMGGRVLVLMAGWKSKLEREWSKKQVLGGVTTKKKAFNIVNLMSVL